ncbi:hypothetical protein FRC04_004913 [Tulasnella sp. 424]|nr:hypothetical protein FRC04_004913 [Tulasnella sp. 424]
MMSETDFIRFEGKDASEAEEFIRSINIRAFTANKLKDDEWMALLATTAFTGQALRWYTTLSPAVRDSWDALKKALLLQYQPSSTTFPLTPTAPAAGPPDRNILSPAQPRTGRIRVVFESNTSGMTYLCGDLSFNGVYTWTQDVSKALIVKHSPEELSLEVLDGNTVKCYAGAQSWDLSPQNRNLGKEGTGYLHLTPVRATSPDLTASLKYPDGRPGTGRIIARFWDVGSDGALLPLVWQYGVQYCLGVCVFTDSKELALTSDYAAFSKRWKPNELEKVQLRFEPL